MDGRRGNGVFSVNLANLEHETCRVQRTERGEDIVNRSRGEHLQSEVLVACFADGRISHPGYCQVKEQGLDAG